MRWMFLTICILLFGLSTSSCPVCERNQLQILQGITHGTGPESKWDYVIVWIVTAIVLLTLFFSIKWLVRPGEQSDLHIKKSILNNP